MVDDLLDFRPYLGRLSVRDRVVDADMAREVKGNRTPVLVSQVDYRNQSTKLRITKVGDVFCDEVRNIVRSLKKKPG